MAFWRQLGECRHAVANCAAQAEKEPSFGHVDIFQTRPKGEMRISEAARRARVHVSAEYLSGQGSLLSVNEKHNISSPPLFLEWVQVYNRHKNSEQEAGGAVMAKTRKTTLEERVGIVKEHFENGKSCSEIAAEFGLSYHVVYDWIKKYQALGIAGLEDRRGQRTARREVADGCN